MHESRWGRAGVLAAALLLLAAPAAAVELKLGYSTALSFERRLNTVVVADPKIVETSVVFGNSLVMIGRSVGATNVVLLDDEGRKIDDLQVFVAPSPAVGHPVDVVHGSRPPRIFRCYRNGCVPSSPDAWISGAGVGGR
ncbi:MAG TPA: pilus assembly protein N-terminal domain-containing protein [Microvirga sp.]|jgi:Flp pilus assembly secretin CpaC|nr:pilus assembly protein N-terminal domain-containing protein [Microvirga sp.]